MAAIFNDLVIEYKGKKHSIKPTFELINQIERPLTSGGLGISLAGLSGRSSRGEIPISEIARIMAYMLRGKGVALDDGDAYEAILTSGDLQGLITAITSAFFPVIREPAKSDKKKQSQKQKSKTLSGEDSTMSE